MSNYQSLLKDLHELISQKADEEQARAVELRCDLKRPYAASWQDGAVWGLRWTLQVITRLLVIDLRDVPSGPCSRQLGKKADGQDR